MKWNYTGIVVGLPEYGKTSIARALVRKHLGATNGLVFVHDPMHQFGRDGCHGYRDHDAWRRAAFEAKKTGKVIPRGSSLGGTTEEVVSLAQQVGERAGNTQESVRLPILVVLDEGSLSGSGSTWISNEDQQALAMRRHRGVGFVFNVQTPTMLMEQFYLFATDLYLFAQMSDHAAVLDKRMFLEKGTLQRAGVCSLDLYRYLHVRKKVGVVGDAL